jgi:hypothetical protein
MFHTPLPLSCMVPATVRPPAGEVANGGACASDLCLARTPIAKFTLRSTIRSAWMECVMECMMECVMECAMECAVLNSSEYGVRG